MSLNLTVRIIPSHIVRLREMNQAAVEQKKCDMCKKRSQLLTRTFQELCVLITRKKYQLSRIIAGIESANNDTIRRLRVCALDRVEHELDDLKILAKEKLN